MYNTRFTQRLNWLGTYPKQKVKHKYHILNAGTNVGEIISSSSPIHHESLLTKLVLKMLK